MSTAGGTTTTTTTSTSNQQQSTTASSSPPPTTQIDIHKFFMSSSSTTAAAAATTTSGGGGGGSSPTAPPTPPPLHNLLLLQQQQQQQNPNFIPSSSYPPPTVSHNSGGGGGGGGGGSPSFPFPFYPPPPQQQQQQQQQHHHHNLLLQQPQQQQHHQLHHLHPQFFPPPPQPHPHIINPQRSLSFPTPPLQPQPLAPTRSGAEIMDLLRPSSLDPHPPPPSSHVFAPPARTPSSKLPKGRRITASLSLYDVDVRLPGEVPPPQLEVTPITKYVSDPHLCLGRQIAVNKSYICYGLKQGNIRILNINTALRSLFRTLSQRVTDMSFFAEDVHLLASAGIDGRVNVWKISEGPDEEDKPQITGKAVIAIQVTGEGEVKNPRVCWHCYKQEILVVGVGKSVLRIDTNKVGKAEVHSSEAPLQCRVDKLIDGIQLVGKHDGEVTDLSMCRWMTTRLVSASVDGTIKIWEDHKIVPLAVLRPHDGQPVYSASFLTATDRPDHIILITGGPQNREMKIWASASEVGWFLPGDADSLNCTQTLQLKSSAQPSVEEAFFNQVIVLPQVGLLLLANAKRNAIYAIHLDYGPDPAATRMDYISEFTVTMPILSLTGTSDVVHGQLVAQIYCVQTQAIQQYTLELCQCSPLPFDSMVSEKIDPVVSHDGANGGEYATSDGYGSKPVDVPASSSSVEVAAVQDMSSSNMASSTSETNLDHVPSSPLPPRPTMSRNLSEVTGFGNQDSNQLAVDYSVDNSMGSGRVNLSDVPSIDGDYRSDDKKSQKEANPPSNFNPPTLVTPEIFTVASSHEITDPSEGKSDVDGNIQDVLENTDTSNAEVEVKVVDEKKDDELGSYGEPGNLVLGNKERFFCSQASGLGIEMVRECWAVPEAYSFEEPQQQVDGVDVRNLSQDSHVSNEDVLDGMKDESETVPESPVPAAAQSTPSSTRGKKQKGKIHQAVDASSPSPSAFNSTDSANEAGASPHLHSAEPGSLQFHDKLDQLLAGQKEIQKEMLKQMSNLAAQLPKEFRKAEGSLGRHIEKTSKANSDAQLARLQEEIARIEKSHRDLPQQIASSLSNCVNKELAPSFEKMLKKELASVGQVLSRTVTPVVEKSISSSIADCFQKGVGDKAVNQLEKSVTLKLEATVARQIQMQFQTSVKQALQEALKVSLEASVVPAFERSCKAMFEQVDATFKKGMLEHTALAEQHFESLHSPLALTLRETINSAAALIQSLNEELAESQRKLIAIATAGANQTVANPLLSQLSNGPLGGLREKVDTHVDPTKELSRLITEGKYEEAFTSALQKSDLSIVSWLCAQVDLRAILSAIPLPLSQGVLLSLLQQLACDINKDTARKLTWMTDVAAAINPEDQMIKLHVVPILDQVCGILHHQRSLPTMTGQDIASIRVLLHVINSTMASCK